MFNNEQFHDLNDEYIIYNSNDRLSGSFIDICNNKFRNDNIVYTYMINEDVII